jgi:hypothetical protein
MDEFKQFEGGIYNPIDVSRTWEDWATDTNIRRLRGLLRDDVFVRTELSMIYGPGGSGKSYLAKYIGICVAMGFQVHNMRTVPGRVLFLSEEMPHQVIHQRCQRMLSKESAQALGDRFHIRCQSEFDFSERILASQKKLEAIINEIRAELVFIDCLADIHHADENSNSAMGVVMKSIRAVARITGACIIVVHHMGKPGEDGVSRGARGASVMKDTCESMVMVKPIGKKGEPRSLVQFEKARHVVGRIPAPFEFVQEEDQTRMVLVSDPGEPEIMKSGIVFTTSDHKDYSAEDRSIRRVKELVGLMLSEYPDNRVPAGVVKDQLIKEGSSEKKAKETIRRAKAVGVVVALDAGRFLCLPSS